MQVILEVVVLTLFTIAIAVISIRFAIWKKTPALRPTQAPETIARPASSFGPYREAPSDQEIRALKPDKGKKDRVMTDRERAELIDRVVRMVK